MKRSRSGHEVHATQSSQYLRMAPWFRAQDRFGRHPYGLGHALRAAGGEVDVASGRRVPLGDQLLALLFGPLGVLARMAPLSLSCRNR